MDDNDTDSSEQRIQDGGGNEKKHINELMAIFKKIVPKFGTLNVKYESFRVYMKRMKKMKKNKEKPLNDIYATWELVINLLLILTGKRKACLTNSNETIINPDIIKVFEEMIDLFDGTLAFEWVCFVKNKRFDYQVIFYNTKLIKQKVVRDALDSYNPNLKHKSGCCCTSCNGGETYTKKLQKVLDYLCEPMKKIDYNDYDYYNVSFLIQYKKMYLQPCYYMCSQKPSTKRLKDKFLDMKPVLDALNAKLEISISHHKSPFRINNKTYKTVK